MSNIGIIAEYNPYHNGHKYLVKNAIKETDADGVIALMSGNFIQRGAPAMADKYSRAEAAVSGGIDIVFELPVIYATSSARDFANGAIAMLSSIKNIDYVAFGVEDMETSLFFEIADILANEPEEYKNLLNEYLAKGNSYPSASEKAIKKILGTSIGQIISKPNNILGISYISALIKQKSHIKPILIERCDSGYNSAELTGNYASATAIRNAIMNNTSIRPYIPKVCVKPYEEYFSKPLSDITWLTPYIASRMIYDRNLPHEISNLEGVMDMTEEILNRLRKAPLPIKYIELADFLKTKNITMTRVSRVLLHMVLGILTEDRELALNNGYAKYLNLLAFKGDKSSLLKSISMNTELSVINKKANYKPQSELGQRLWEMDKLATDLYNQLVYDNLNIRLHSELTCTVRKVN